MNTEQDFPEYIEEKKSFEQSLQDMMSEFSGKIQNLNSLIDAPTLVKIIQASNLSELEDKINEFLPTEWIKSRDEIKVLAGHFVVVIEYYLTEKEKEND